ncbi:MAG: 1,4-dihydroxy-6-naphthoate synthase [Syntrophobacteraceae bacterium]|jgi:1,4-dihydroxy-6-naphthoate synthase|nr:1,4-dihydroxy-6-naphthoate synthase [Syntrophobacteraceae bacterium]
MTQVLHLGYSPCPNDTFIFCGLASGRVSTHPHDLKITLADVEWLNRQALSASLDITKVSITAMLHLLDSYWLLGSGGAIGRGCGPLIVAREAFPPAELMEKRVAIPGRMTTANVLLQLSGLHRGPLHEMVFDQVMPAVQRGDVDAGVIIHEGRFTYPAHGLTKVLDLGAWWERETGLPLALGGIAVKRELGSRVASFFEEKIRQSLLHARAHPEEVWPYVRQHAQEMAPDVIRSHIDMFVNDFSIEAGEEGERAIRALLEAAAVQQNRSMPALPLFWSS